MDEPFDISDLSKNKLSSNIKHKNSKIYSKNINSKKKPLKMKLTAKRNAKDIIEESSKKDKNKLRKTLGKLINPNSLAKTSLNKITLENKKYDYYSINKAEYYCLCRNQNYYQTVYEQDKCKICK